MQIKRTTEYAIRCMMYFCNCQRTRKIEEISESIKVPIYSLRKILKALVEANIIFFESGKTGGYALAKSPEKISLYDVIELFENKITLNACLEDEKRCPVQKYLYEVQEEVVKKFKDVTFLELYEQTDEYREKCMQLLTWSLKLKNEGMCNEEKECRAEQI